MPGNVKDNILGLFMGDLCLKYHIAVSVENIEPLPQPEDTLQPPTLTLNKLLSF